MAGAVPPQTLCSEFVERHRGLERCDTVTDPCDRRGLWKPLQRRVSLADDLMVIAAENDTQADRMVVIVARRRSTGS